MPKNPHEALHHIFREAPSLLSHLLEDVVDEDFADPNAVSVLNVDLTEVRPMIRFTDTALLLSTGDTRHIFVIESQTKPDDEKRIAWPYYIAYLHNEYKCDVTLLVLCPEQAVAEWAAQPITIGLKQSPCMEVRPLGFGPEDIPTITAPEEAQRDIKFAVFSALIHRFDAAASDNLDVLAAALDTIDTEIAKDLAVFTEAGLGESTAQQIWRQLMDTQTYRYQTQIGAKQRAEGRAEGRTEGRAEGEAVGRAKDVVRLLERRGISLEDATRQQILTCRDLDQLDTWFDRAITATSTDDLFI